MVSGLALFKKNYSRRRSAFVRRLSARFAMNVRQVAVELINRVDLLNRQVYS
jgi:hypothetical protein